MSGAEHDLKPQPSEIAGDSVAKEAEGVSNSASNRRQFLCKSARAAAYVSPVVLLFRPKAAIAASGQQSQQTNEQLEGEGK